MRTHAIGDRRARRAPAQQSRTRSPRGGALGLARCYAKAAQMHEATNACPASQMITAAPRAAPKLTLPNSPQVSRSTPHSQRDDPSCLAEIGDLSGGMQTSQGAVLRPRIRSALGRGKHPHLFLAPSRAWAARLPIYILLCRYRWAALRGREGPVRAMPHSTDHRAAGSDLVRSPKQTEGIATAATTASSRQRPPQVGYSAAHWLSLICHRRRAACVSRACGLGWRRSLSTK
jgi:hypothetical protein